MNIIVAGGGTAGWLTALYVKKVYPTFNIKVIESKEVGILGAGEGSTPHLVPFLNFLDIPLEDLILHVGATVKNGIKFSGWSNSSTDYFYHPFTSVDGHLLQELSELNRVPFILKDKTYIETSSWSWHFNAIKLANYLKTQGINRGIKAIEETILYCSNDGLGNITSITTAEDTYDCDFVFDCTGFARMFIGKTFNSKWISHSDSLPAKKAIPFFLELEDTLPPYTESTAMNCGWMWKIPTQDRFGCGYVFDSDYISDDEAIKEIEDYLGFEPEYPRKTKGAFNFSAGCYEEIWINNCLAIGLSSGFIEPLEATSIMQFIIVLKRFVPNQDNFKTKDKNIKDKFNKTYVKETKEVVDFIYLHYLTNKRSPFWLEFSKKNKIPEFVAYIIKEAPIRGVSNSDFSDKSIFMASNYAYILEGNGLLNRSTIINNNQDHINFIKNILGI